MQLNDALNQHGIPQPPSHLKPNAAGFIRWNNYWMKQEEGVAVFGNWETGESHQWFEDSVTPLDAKQIAERKAKVAAMHREREAELLKQQEEAALTAQTQWADLSAYGQSEYLTRKQIHGHGIRYGQGGSIIVPVRDTAGKIWSLQTIHPDGSKRFYAGGRKKGLFHAIGSLENAEAAIVVEGYATGASVHMATFKPAIVAFDAGNLEPVIAAVKAAYPKLALTIAADNDQWKDANTGKDKANEAAKKHRCKVVLPVFDTVPTDNKPTDFNDLHLLAGVEAVRKQLEPSDNAPKDKAKMKTLVLPEPEPWHEPVDGGELMEGLVAELRKYLALPQGSAEAIALWCIFTHGLDAFFYSPRLFFSSPEKQCGKSTAMKIVSKLAWRPLMASNISPAAIYRTVESFRPTLLLDEADTYFQKNEDLRGVLNSGHDKETAIIIRCEGDNNEAKPFSTWAAYAIAGIGRIPDTLEDRSVIVHMRRKMKEDAIIPYRPHKAKSFDILARKIRRWVDDHIELLRSADPALTDKLAGRAGDNWTPLLAIADTIGGDWPQRARSAAADLLKHDLTDDLSIGVQLLADLQAMFDEKAEGRVSTKDACSWLAEQEERPWAEWGWKKQPITPPQLANLLKKYNIKPKTIRLSPYDTCKGYVRDDFEEAFRRYIPQGQSPENAVTPSQAPSRNSIIVTNQSCDVVTAKSEGAVTPAIVTDTPNMVEVVRI